MTSCETPAPEPAWPALPLVDWRDTCAAAANAGGRDRAALERRP